MASWLSANLRESSLELARLLPEERKNEVNSDKFAAAIPSEEGHDGSKYFMVFL
jgi:hypothetical protein